MGTKLAVTPLAMKGVACCPPNCVVGIGGMAAMITHLRTLVSHSRGHFKLSCHVGAVARLSSTPRSGEDATCSHDENSVLVNWKGQCRTGWSRYHHIWLRDSCLCSHCFHAQTNQRLVDTLQLPLDVKPKEVSLSDSGLQIQWQDGHESVYPIKWLMKNSYEHGEVVEPERSADDEPLVWGNEVALNPPCVEFDAVMNTDRAVLEWLEKIEKYGFCFVEQTPLEPDMSKRLMERVGVIRDTFYGAFWVFSPSFAGSDTAYTNFHLDSHTDGNYFSEAPGLQMFHCLHFQGTGGQSMLVDGFRLAEEIQKRNAEHFCILSSVPIPYHHTDKDHKFLNYNIPFIIDPKTDRVSRVHFNDTDRLPFDNTSIKAMQCLGVTDYTQALFKLYEALQTFLQTMKEEAIEYRFRLEPGRALLFNNHRVLHGRTAFTGQRKMCGGYINREDYISRLTVLRERVN